jgi:arylformamidase
VDQCVRAVARLRDMVSSGAIPASSLVLSGSSAGAHLAAMVLARSDAADAAVLLSGVFDLRPVVHTYVNDALGLDDAEAARLSPLLLQPVRHVPIVVAVGGVETGEFKRQSRAFADAWSAWGATEVVEVAHRNHFDLPEDLGDPATELGALAEKLIPR